MDAKLRCVVCSAPLYNTDQSLSELSYHCSSKEASFWDFDRGSVEQLNAKNHWDRSKQEIPNRIKNQMP
jgi:hypothetical protein